VKLALQDPFTFQEWQEQFFQTVLDKTQPQHHTRDRTPPLHNKDCYCAKTLSEWLFDDDFGMNRERWCKEF